MRGAYVQEKESAPFRQGWRNGSNSAPAAKLPGLPEPHSLRQGAYTPAAQALDTERPCRVWGSPGTARNTMFSDRGNAHVHGAGKGRLYRRERPQFVLPPRAIQNPYMALDLDALLAESTTNKRLGKAASKLILPVYIWHLWNATGIKSGTSENGKQATGIKSGTCGGGFSIPQVPNIDHSY